MPEQMPADTGGATSSGLRPEAAVEADDHGRDGEGAQGRLPVVPRAPFKVSKEEVEAHNATHTPYRAWCEVCVRARGRNTPHMTRDEAAKRGGVPRISFDYFFASRRESVHEPHPGDAR